MYVRGYMFFLNFIIPLYICIYMYLYYRGKSSKSFLDYFLLKEDFVMLTGLLMSGCYTILLIKLLLS